MKHLRTLLWLPAALWYRVIWGFSAQNAAVSGDLSDRLLWRLMERLSPAFAAGAFETRNAAVELLSFFERKAAHMFLYFVLILLLWLALAPLLRGRKRQAGLAAVLCALLAALSPVLREFCFLAFCGLLGAFAVLGAFLSLRSPLAALTASLGLAEAFSVLPALVWGLPAPIAAGAAALGWAVGLGLWLAYLAAKALAPRLS